MKPLTLPVSEWPASDRTMLTRLSRVGSPLNGPGPLSHCRQTTLVGYTKAYARWLGWLQCSEPDALFLPPTQRATPERLMNWLASLSHTSPHFQGNMIGWTVRILMAAEPEADWSEAKRLWRYLTAAAKSSVSLRKVGRILTSDVHFAAAQRLAGPIAAQATTELARHLMLRDATILALLTIMPIRLRSLSELELGKSVIVTESGITISLSRAMTKNGRLWHAKVPKILLPILYIYLNEVRPWLLKRGPNVHASLWVNRMGGPLAYATLANLIPRVTKSLHGVAASPHLLRDSAATFISRQSAQNAKIIAPLLGHKRPGTWEKHYSHGGMDASCSALGDLIDSDRKRNG